MKQNKFLFVILLVLLMACKETNDSLPLTTLKGESGWTYNESFEKWNELKNLNGNSYIYRTTFTSWTGSGSITELKVEKGVVVSRIYLEFVTSETSGEKEVVEEYTENRENLGSHAKGAAPLTIDELYHSCANEYLTVDEENNTLYFEAEINGIISLCGFVPDGCADDCFTGVRISFFGWTEHNGKAVD